MKQLADRGTKIVTVDQTIEDSSFVQTQILTDNAQGGRLAADAINALLDGKGEVLVITQPPGSAAQDARTKDAKATPAAVPADDLTSHPIGCTCAVHLAWRKKAVAR